MRAAVEPGATTADIDAVGADVIADAGAVSNFKGYHGFPATICASVNEEIVHGIPSPMRVLRDGDLISIDAGCVLDGWHSDSASPFSCARTNSRSTAPDARSSGVWSTFEFFPMISSAV